MKNILLKPVIILFILLFFICNTASALTKSRTEARYKACLSNQRVIMNAIEMYNMDHKTAIEKYDENTENLLITEKYLKSKPQKPEQKCEYKMNGHDVYCEYHGGMDPEKLKPSPEFAETLKDILQYRKNKTYEYASQIIILLAAWIWLISLLVKVFSKSKKSKENNNTNQPNEQNNEN
ncbi:MAG: hypothetical protein II961_08535 [Candidatus Riflebacteria bacterium]|nr:hypothetical protein [Candidatus Riflebacteria bacterium]